MSTQINLELTREELAGMVAAAVERKVAQQMPSRRDIDTQIRSHVRGATEAAVGPVVRELVPYIVANWLEAREGWVAKMIGRAVLRAGAGVPK